MWILYGDSMINEVNNNNRIRVDFDEYKLTEEEFNTSKIKDDFSDLLNIGYERLKADKNNDGKVDKGEYIEFIESKQENSLNIDYTFIGSILMVCLTAILITRIIFNSTNRSDKSC